MGYRFKGVELEKNQRNARKSKEKEKDRVKNYSFIGEFSFAKQLHEVSR
jgi:hypothetical protein